MSTELREVDLARDEILYLPIDAIDPDPDQPRLQVDDELRDSIKQHGILQAIEVRPHPSGSEDRWMIVDGERRWRGATAAKLATIPATIKIDVEDEADRLVRQIVRNEGKPLTALEEAKSFQRIIAKRQAAGEKRYGVVQLAKELGIAKSTVSDRLGLLEIPDCWLELMVKGPLQTSHAPILRKWRLVPAKYHAQALEQMKKDYRWPGVQPGRYAKRGDGDRLYVGEFETLVRTYMSKFVKEIKAVPGYKGPTERGKFHTGDYEQHTYAMDPSQWQPLYRKALAAKKSAQGKEAAKTKVANQERTPRWVKVALEGGAKLERQEYFAIHNHGSSYRGVTWILERGRWHFGHRHGETTLFDPAVLCAKQDLSKLVIVQASDSNYERGAYRTVTSWYAGTKDDAAYGQARSAHLKAQAAARAKISDDLGAQLQYAGPETLLVCEVAPHLVRAYLTTGLELVDDYDRKE